LRHEAGSGGGCDLSGLPRGDVLLGGVPFHIADGLIRVDPEGARDPRGPSRVEIPLNARRESLVFLHACSVNGPLQGLGSRRARVGRYEILYSDGSCAEVELEYGWQLAEWNRRYGAPLAHTAHRHAGYIATYPCLPFWQGKGPSGEDTTLYGFEWRNPHPEKAIRALRVIASDAGTDAALIVAAITGISCEDAR
jgi:hypothetical protein